MKLTRRMFFGTAAAAPLAARQAAAEAVRAGQLGGNMAAFGYQGESPRVGGPAGKTPYDMAHEQIRECFQRRTIPAWKLAEMRIVARARAAVLDDDLVALQSWSGAARRRAQIEREIQRQIEEWLVRDGAQSGWQSVLDKFRSLFGEPNRPAQPPQGRGIA